MGDHRAECHIIFKFHEKTYTLDLDWVNWDDVDGDGIDSRVRTFFSQATEDGMRRYRERIDEVIEREEASKTEETERAELVRLKAKYERGQ